MRAPFRFSLTAELLRRRGHELMSGGCHTDTQGDDPFPESALPFVVRGAGCHAWDLDGREYIEYGKDLRAVTLGHDFLPVVEAVKRTVHDRVNHARTVPVEIACAEPLQALVPSAERVEFCRDGSHPVGGAIRQARTDTGRKGVALCADHSFFSSGDWFIGTGAMKSGISDDMVALVRRFHCNDWAELQALFAAHPGEIAPETVDAACQVYRAALDGDVHDHIEGPPVQPDFRRFA